jgi:carbon storage regulator
MLVVSRKKDEAVVITDEITITVIDIRGDRVRLGIDAPMGAEIHRKEVYDLLKKEKEIAEKNKGEKSSDDEKL